MAWGWVLRGSLRSGHKVGKTVGNSTSPQCRNLGFGALVCVECVRVYESV